MAIPPIKPSTATSDTAAGGPSSSSTTETAEPSTTTGHPGIAAALSAPTTHATVQTFSPTILRHLKQISSGTAATSPAQTAAIASFHSTTATVTPASLAQPPDLPTLLSYIASPAQTAQSPPPASATDLGKPLSWYFISSSHNTYLSGNQIYGESSGEAYENVLRRGCRCVEIDVWDGEEREREKEREEEKDVQRRHRGLAASLRSGGDGLKSRITERLHGRSPSRGHGNGNEGSAQAFQQPERWTTASTQMRREPRVLHGYTLTKDVPFREVCEAIRDSAFVHSDLPVIASLEVHASSQQQEVMVEIMEDTWAGLMVQLDTSNCKVLPSPDSLRNKILVKVKAAPLQSTPDQLAAETAQIRISKPQTDTSGSSDDEINSLRRKNTGPKAKKSSVIPALSAMGKYTRAFHFKDLNQPEALLPTHVFSLSEKKLMDVHAAPGPSIFSHNKDFLMRAYPSGTRLSSSNLDPDVFWRKGVQMVALNWQKFDAGTMMNEAQFSGTGGWLLKPEGYHGSPTGETKLGSELQVDAMPRKRVQLSITLLAAQHLPVKRVKDKGSRLSPYIKCEFHVERSEEVIGSSNEQEGHAKGGKYKLESKNSKTADPDFLGEVLDFPAVDIVEEFSFIRFKIMDDVLGKDDLLAWSCIRLDRLREGYRLVELLSADGSETDAVLLVKIEKRSK